MVQSTRLGSLLVQDPSRQIQTVSITGRELRAHYSCLWHYIPYIFLPYIMWTIPSCSAESTRALYHASMEEAPHTAPHMADDNLTATQDVRVLGEELWSNVLLVSA